MASPRLTASAALLAAIVLAACGGDSARDDALDGLDRATQASDLQGEMAELVAAIPDDTAQAGAEVETQLADIDGRAGELIESADTGTDYDEQIAAAATDTKSAGTQVSEAVAAAKPLNTVRPQVVSSLSSSGEQLDSATTLIGTELQDENGELSAEDAEALEGTLAEIDEADAATAAARDYRDLVFDFGGVGNLRVGMTAEEAAAAGAPLDLGEPITDGPCVSYSVRGFDSLGGIAQDGQTISSIGINTGETSASQAQTTEGVGIGSSIAEFEAAYPGLVQQEETVSAGTKYSVKQDDGIIVFSEFGDGSVSFLGVGPGALAFEGCL